MTSIETEPWDVRISQEFDIFCEKLEAKLDKQQKQIKACKKITEIENKMALEVKLKKDLTQQLTELSRVDTELERVCTAFESRLTIADSDQNRLENAKELYQLAKELTGIRLDFSAPSNIAKGYVKNKARRLLVPFELATDSDAMWDLIKTTTDPLWTQKENHAPN